MSLRNNDPEEYGITNGFFTITDKNADEGDIKEKLSAIFAQYGGKLRDDLLSCHRHIKAYASDNSVIESTKQLPVEWIPW